MASEIKLTISGTIAKGSFKDSITGETFNITQTGNGSHSPVVSVGTSEEDLTVGDVTTLGWLYLKNLDAANFIQWGPKSAGSMVAVGRLKAGEFVLLRLEPGITIRWIANTAAVNVQVKLYQD